MGFREFFYEDKFVGVEFAEETRLKLTAYCLENGLDITKNFKGEYVQPIDFDFHVTIFYTADEPKIPMSDGFWWVDPFEVEASHIEMMGHNYDTPAIILKPTKELLQVRKFFEVKYDLIDEWYQFKPHISLTYNYQGFPDIDILELPDFPLIVNKLKIKES